MFKNYFKTAWRNITRKKAYSFINILGLALGISACITIYLITSYEFSFDKFHPDGDRIYRIVGEMQKSSGEKGFLNSPTSDVAGFQNRIPGFESEVGIQFYSANISIRNGAKEAKNFNAKIAGTYTTSTIITTPQYFDIFKYQWLEGHENVLDKPFKVVLTEKRAHQYFGNLPLNNIIGKTVTYDDSLNVTVAGIVKDWAGNTDFGYTDFISISTATNSFLKSQIPANDWSSLSPHRSMAFVKLSKGVTAAEINNRFASFIKEHVKLDDPGSLLTMRLQPLATIHFTTDFHRGDDGDNFRKAYLPTLYALMGVALFILIIAIVNFINLSTAQSVQRAKEIGVRKVMGSNKRNIMLQFLTETFVVTLFAVMLSVLLVKPLLHFFSEYIPAGVSFHLFNKSTLIFLLIITLITSLLAGFYPSKVLASYLPVLSLKGVSQKGTDKINLRKVLIVFQFAISLIFIIGVLVIGKQINYMGNADKGFNTDAIITMNNWGDHEGKLKILADEVKNIPGIDKVLLQGNSPMGFAQSIDNYKYKGKEEINVQVSAQIGNEDFIPFYQMKLIAGRNILHSDSLNEVVINKTMAKVIGFTSPHDAVGKMLYQEGYQVEKPVPVVGVVNDFHTGSFHELIQPAVIENVPDRKSSLAIKLSADEKDIKDVKKILSQIEAQWKKIFPETPFDYSFLNEAITKLYEQEKNTQRLMNAAMIIAIFISCMGLFGLGMFTAQRKTKEIGIRKVLGASVADITVMLSKDFIVLVLTAIIIASPVAWYFSNKWLQDFAYRTNVSWWLFALAGGFSILIALFTISFQSIKAAVANPVKSLRTE